ncbi:beta-glucoside-specific PTS transporter subunit IIABC [Priestia endophytica]|uniref:PTS beta-glucoside transporter subunit EIIBCA n=1 Tax=Priestia endophytica TaxID=135735 RepID=A0AAX1QA60_9BACI|nr:beta-glucoside-specific PTS transporter subunit IIABC [Priestia endophytica]RAS77243.1 PTS beta-glucoside transporter subunit EIIBCA [Priestia endophytica]
MGKKYEKLGKDIVEKIGGSENVSTFTHCMTRLRFALNDNRKANLEGIKSLDGIVNVIESGGQVQVVVGAHVEQVYQEVVKHIKTSENENNEGSHEKKGFLNKVIDFVSGTFGPLIPAIAGAGMIKAVLALLLVFNLITRESETYYVISFMADTIFYFLPIVLAYSAANKLKCNPVFAMVLAGILIHPNMSELRIAGEDVSIFGIPMSLVNYGSSVVPILLIVWAQSYIEPFFKKIIPDAVKIIFVPLFTILVTGIIGVSLLGPIGSFIGDYLAMAFDLLGAQGSWIIIFLIATFWPILVMFGIHYSLSPLSVAQLTTLGYENIIGPGAMLANLAQGVAALVVGLRVKDAATKQIASSTGITGLMGITEPALYGINLPKKYPLIATMIGGACGGLYAGIMNVSRYAIGHSGIPAIPLYIGENMWNLYNILIGSVITIIVTAVLTYILTFKYEKDLPTKDVSKQNEGIGDVNTTMIKSIVLSSAMKGEIVPLSDVKDEAFATEAMGKGIAIDPSEGKVVAPFNGEIVSLFPTKHAIGLLSENGIEVLIHVGLNTVELEGKYFEAHVEQGQKITTGQTLLTFDLDKIRQAGYVTQTPIIITNTYNYSDVSTSKTNTKIDFNNDLLILKA